MVTKLAPGAFFGRTHHCREVAGITLTESLYGPEVIIPPHEHAAAYFDFVLEDLAKPLPRRIRLRRW
jgi:AraC family transcriptional regulator